MAGLKGSSRWMATMALGLVVAVVLGACSGDNDGGESSAGGGVAGEVEQDSLGGEDSVASVDEDSSGAPGGIESVRQVDLSQDDSVFGSARVIKDGRVELAVERDAFDETVDDVYFLATRLGGIVASTAIDDSGDGRGTVVVRIPSGRFEDALTELREIGRIESQYVDTQDVTDEFVDLESRIRNARTAETVLLNLMDEASTISDTIRVQNQLERVQENIERMRGRLRVLDDQTSFSTLSVDLVEAGAAPEDEPREAGMLGQAWRDAVDGFMGVVSAVIVASGVLLPIAILALIVVLLVRRLRPRFEREAQPAPATEL